MSGVGKRSRLPDMLGAATVSTLILGGTWALAQLGLPVLDAVAKAASPTALLHVILILLVSLAFAVAWALSLRRELKSPSASDFDFEKYGGYYVDRRTGTGVCTHCLNLEVPRVVHLMDAGGGLMCNACDKVYRSADDK